MKLFICLAFSMLFAYASAVYPVDCGSDATVCAQAGKENTECVDSKCVCKKADGFGKVNVDACAACAEDGDCGANAECDDAKCECKDGYIYDLAAAKAAGGGFGCKLPGSVGACSGSEAAADFELVSDKCACKDKDNKELEYKMATGVYVCEESAAGAVRFSAALLLAAVIAYLL